MTSNKIICSICQEEIPASLLRAHQAEENREIVAYTIDLIKQANPEWTEGDPTCQKCWDQYFGTATKSAVKRDDLGAAPRRNVSAR